MVSSAEATPSNPTPSAAPQVSLAEQVIERFGGIRPMASKLEIPVTTVQGWKKRGAIPPTRLNDLRTAARRHGIRIEDHEMAALGRGDDRTADAAAPPSQPGDAPMSSTPPASATPTPTAAPDPGQDATAPAPPIETAAEIPPVDIPRYDIPPPEIPLRAASDGPSARPETPPAATPAPPPRAAAPSAPVAAAAAAPNGTAGVADAGGGSAGQVPDDRSPRVDAMQPTPKTPVDKWAGLSVAAAVVAMVSAGVAVMMPFWPQGPNGEATLAPRAVEKRVGEMEGKISRLALEQVATSAALERRINAVDSRIADARIEISRTISDLATRVGAVEGLVSDIESRITSMPVGSPTLAMLLAAGQLRAALATEQPFQSALAAVRMAGFGDPAMRRALDQVAGRAATGVATEQWLADRFDVFAPAIIWEATSGAPVARMLDSVVGLVREVSPPLYRLTGIPRGDNPRGIAERAQLLLATGKFDDAVAEVAKLTGAAAEAAAPWLTEARARQAANRVRSLLNQQMMALVSTAPTVP